MSEEAIAAALLEENRSRCEPPLSEDEVRHIAHSCAKYTPEDAPQFAAIEENGTELSWTTPRSLRAARELPVFPTAAFPAWLDEFVRAEALTTQTPVDMAAMFALGNLATVCGGRVVVKAAADWTEGTNLFVVAAMEPGSRKSAVERDLKAPILEYERRLAERERPKIAEQASLRRVAEARRDRAEKAAATATAADRFALEQEALVAARALEAIVVPAELRLFTADATPEALMGLLAAHGGRMSVLSAEGGVFDLMAGRYSNGIPNLDVYLSGHAGDTLRVDRRNRPPEFVDRPALTMALAAQPFLLRKIGRNAEMSGRGLLDRFLYAVPIGNVGFRMSSPPAMPEGVQACYAEKLTALAEALATYDEPLVLRLATGAGEALTAWRDELEPRRRPDRDLGGMQGWSSKLDGATVRIAGLLHLTGAGGFGRPITKSTMDGAIGIARYLIPHARTAFDLMGVDAPLEDARRILRWIVSGQRTEFTRRECHRALTAHFPRAEDLDPALALLAEHGWIRAAEDVKRPGRPSIRYQVNPAMHSTEPTQPTKPPTSSSSVGSVGSVVSHPFHTESDPDTEERPME